MLHSTLVRSATTAGYYLLLKSPISKILRNFIEKESFENNCASFSTYKRLKLSFCRKWQINYFSFLFSFCLFKESHNWKQACTFLAFGNNIFDGNKNTSLGSLLSWTISVVYMCSFLNAFIIKWQYLCDVMPPLKKQWGLVIWDHYLLWVILANCFQSYLNEPNLLINEKDYFNQKVDKNTLVSRLVK